MAITVQFGDPYAVGQAGLVSGIGDFQKYAQQQALREQAMALQEAQFAEQQKQNEFGQRFSYDQLRLRADQFNQDYRLQQQRLASDNAFRSASLQDQQQARMIGLAERQSSERAAMSRQQQQIIAEAENRNFQMRANMAIADWQAIQKANSDFDFPTEGHYQAAVDAWQQQYSDLGMPTPFAAPFQESSRPAWMDDFSKRSGIDIFDENGRLLEGLDPSLVGQVLGFVKTEKDNETRLESENRKYEYMEKEELAREQIRQQEKILTDIKHEQELNRLRSQLEAAKAGAAEDSAAAQDKKVLTEESAINDAYKLNTSFISSNAKRAKLVADGMSPDEAMKSAGYPVINAPAEAYKTLEEKEKYERMMADSLPVGFITYNPRDKKFYEKVADLPFSSGKAWREVSTGSNMKEKMIGLDGDIFMNRTAFGGEELFYDTGTEVVPLDQAEPPKGMTKEQWKSIKEIAKTMKSVGDVEIREDNYWFAD